MSRRAVRPHADHAAAAAGQGTARTWHVNLAGLIGQTNAPEEG